MSIKNKSLAGKDTFGKAIWITIGGLSTICLLFIVLNALQGPRLRRAELDIAAVVQQPNQKLVMYTNQSIKKVDSSQVTIRPRTDFTVLVSGESLIIQFDQRLLYNTSYTVTATNISALYRKDITSTLQYSFKTNDPEFYFIRRNQESYANNLLLSKKPDEIVRTSVGVGREKVIFQSEKIQDYVSLGDLIVVNTINDLGGGRLTNGLYLVNSQTEKSEELSLPGEGIVTNLRASPNGQLIGYSFTSLDEYDALKYQNVLFIMDATAKQLPHPVNGLDGKPTQITDWQFAPDGMTIVIQTYDTDLLLIDVNGQNKPIPLGQFNGMSNFSHNGSKIIGDDAEEGLVVIDLLEYSHETIVSEAIDGIQPYVQDALLLHNGDGLVKHLELAERDSTTYWHYLVLSKDEQSRVLYKGGDNSSRLGKYDISPNDQYITAETYLLDPKSRFDSYPETPKQTNIQTKIIEMDSGKVLRAINGFKVIWR